MAFNGRHVDQVFFDEAEELLAEKERLLLAVDVAQPDAEDLNAIFRTAHSVKGGASTFGVTDMTEVTHVLETLLDRIRKGEMALTAEHVDAFLAAKDILKMQLDGHRHGHPVDQPAVDALLTELHAMADEQGVAVVASEAAPALKTNKQIRIGLPDMAASDIQSLSAELGLLGEIAIIDHIDLTLRVDQSNAFTHRLHLGLAGGAVAGRLRAAGNEQHAAVLHPLDLAPQKMRHFPCLTLIAGYKN